MRCPHFDAITRSLVDPTAHGHVQLTDKDIKARIDHGGDLSTTAINALKVVVFDLATLALTMEGRPHLPAFLIHDSPREADLGLSAHHRLFEFAHRLEDIGPAPLFQYIITTTTRPPEALRQEPWLRLELGGTPADERLLRVDL